MDKTFIIKGVNPLGRVVELRIVAASEADAKQHSEDSGLKFVVVTASPDGVLPSPPTVH